MFRRVKKERNVSDKEERILKNHDGSMLEINVDVKRRAFNNAEFFKTYPVSFFVGVSLLTHLKDFGRKHFLPSKSCFWNTIQKRVPATRWLRNYKFGEYLLNDLLSGITVAIIHIPQSMAYALLATVPPIYGLYTSFFPVLTYWIFGTSKQLSIGTFAVISLMVAGTIADLESKYAPPVSFNYTLYLLNIENNIPNAVNAENFLSLDREKARVMIAAANAFWVGIIQIGMFCLQLGFITSYFSEPFLNGFLLGSSIHVVTSQLKFIFGIKLSTHHGIFEVPKTFIELFSRLSETNLTVLGISVVCITVLLLFKIHVNERFQKKMPVSFPIELVVVILGTLISHFTKISSKNDVGTVGFIPPGIPMPTLPSFHIIKDMLLSSFIIALISFAINFSLTDMFAKKHKYRISSSQEFLAYGASNVVGSFFSCFVSGASLARSCVQDNSGGKTQIVSIVSCVIIGFVMSFIAPLFRELPHACLASIIVVALKSLILKIFDLSYYWHISKIEFCQFLITFLSVVVLKVDIGLGLGITFYIITHIFRSTFPYSTLLGNISGTELYKDIKLYKDAKEIQGIKIIRFQQEIHATNSAIFKKTIYMLTGVKPHERMLLIKKAEKNENGFCKSISRTYFAKLANKCQQYSKSALPNIYFIEHLSSVKNEIHPVEDKKPHTSAKNQLNVAANLKRKVEKHNSNENNDKDHDDDTKKVSKLDIDSLIIDFSTVNFVDSVGIKTINQIMNDYWEIGVNVYLADMNDCVRDKFLRMEKACSLKNERITYLNDNLIHVSIHDAVLYVLNKRKSVHY